MTIKAPAVFAEQARRQVQEGVLAALATTLPPPPGFSLIRRYLRMSAEVVMFVLFTIIILGVLHFWVPLWQRLRSITPGRPAANSAPSESAQKEGESGGKSAKASGRPGATRKLTDARPH